MFLYSGFQYQLRKASMTEVDAFAFLKGDQQGDFITYTAFLEALRQVRFISSVPNSRMQGETVFEE